MTTEITSLARKFQVQVDQAYQSNGGVTPSWVTVYGIQDLKPAIAATLQPDSDYETNGWESQTKTGLAWSLDLKLLRRYNSGDPTTYDPGQEVIRAAHDQFGSVGVVNLRWYDRNGGPEAYLGLAEVSWAPDGGDNKTLETVSVTLTGKGIRTLLSPNPVSTGPDTVVPTISSITPSSVSHLGGAEVVIIGAGFANVTGASHVTFGGTNATSYTVISDTEIVATVAAGSAGAANCVVTNTIGASTAKTFTLT